MFAVRKLSACDADQLKGHLRRLSADDVRLRFGHAVKDAGLDSYAEAIDWSQTWAVGVFDKDRLHGVVELRRIGSWWSRNAELSVSVEGPYQKQGLGTRLVAEALLVARNRGLRTVFLLCLPENQPIRKIVRKFSGELTAVEGDIEARIRTMQPTPLSVMTEVFGDGCALLLSLLGQSTDVPMGGRGRA